MPVPLKFRCSPYVFHLDSLFDRPPRWDGGPRRVCHDGWASCQERFRSAHLLSPENRDAVPGPNAGKAGGWTNPACVFRGGVRLRGLTFGLRCCLQPIPDSGGIVEAARSSGCPLGGEAGGSGGFRKAWLQRARARGRSWPSRPMPATRFRRGPWETLAFVLGRMRCHRIFPRVSCGDYNQLRVRET